MLAVGISGLGVILPIMSASAFVTVQSALHDQLCDDEELLCKGSIEVVDSAERLPKFFDPAPNR